MNQNANGLVFEEWAQWLEQLQQPGTFKQVVVISALGLLSLAAVYVLRKLMIRWFGLEQEHTTVLIVAPVVKFKLPMSAHAALAQT